MSNFSYTTKGLITTKYTITKDGQPVDMRTEGFPTAYLTSTTAVLSALKVMESRERRIRRTR